jgi:CRP/FNR family transcriptional regulator, cyclic AMP receptor protein
MKPLERPLAQHAFLAGLDKRYLRQLAGLASHKSFQALEMIFHEGIQANEFYLIGKGKVALETALLGCDAIPIQTLGEGEVLGWSWLLPPYQWHYSARAIEPTQVIALDGAALRTLCEQDHDLGYEMMKRFALVIVQRLAATRARFLSFPDPSPAPESSVPPGFSILGEEQRSQPHPEEVQHGRAARR